MKQCPGTKLALAGYSQGAEVVHHALNVDGLPSEQVKAITYFADPGELSQMPGVQAVLTFSKENNQAASGNVSKSLINEYCVKGDAVCEDNVPLVLPPHVTYGEIYGEIAARFIIETTGVSGG